MSFTDDIDKRMESWKDASNGVDESRINTLKNAINNLYEVLRQYWLTDKLSIIICINLLTQKSNYDICIYIRKF